jgi:hypothetical protein
MTIARKPGMQGRRIAAATLFAAAGLLPWPALAGPEGTYAMTGTNPGDHSPYKGVVEVRRTGETYAVTWRFGKDETHGIGTLAAGSDRTFAVSYDAGKSHGIALYELQGDGSWSGVWSSMKGKALGTELWRPNDGRKSATTAGSTANVPANAATPDGKGAARR